MASHATPTGHAPSRTWCASTALAQSSAAEVGRPHDSCRCNLRCGADDQCAATRPANITVVHTVRKSPDAPLSVTSCVCHGDCSYVPSAHTHWAETLYRVKRLWGGLCSIDRLSVAPNRHRITPQCTHAPANCDKHRSLLGLVVDGCALSRHSRARAFIRTASRPAPPTGTRCLGPRQRRLPLPPPRHQCCQPRANGPDWRRPGVSRRPPTPSHVGAACVGDPSVAVRRASTPYSRYWK